MKLYLKFFVTVFIFLFCGLISIHAQEKSIDIDSNHELDIADNKKDQLLIDYPWLEKHIDQKDCQGHKVSVYKMKKGDTKYVFIEETDKRAMYDESGNLYCTNSNELDCQEYYDLISTGESWVCADTK